MEIKNIYLKMNKEILLLLILLLYTIELLKAADIKVMSYNIHHGNPPAQTNGAIDLPGIAAVINQQTPDLVALQEVDKNTVRSGNVNQTASLAALTGLNYYYFAKALDFNGGEYGVAILSKYPIVESYSYLLPRAADLSDEQRVAAIVGININGQKIYFTNTHFDQSTEALRLTQANKIMEIIGQAPFVNQPLILTGDLNTTPVTTSIVKLQENLILARSAAPYTYPADNPTKTIDYVMFNAFMLTDYYVADYQAVSASSASDHLPMVAKLSSYIDNQKNWKYNFGTQTGNLSPKSAAGILSSSDGVGAHMHTLLPVPDNAQLARVWTGNNNVGGYTLTSSGPIGSGSRLFFKLPSTASTSKFSILNIDGTGIMSVGFKIRFDAGTNADYRFALGSDASTMSWAADNTYALPITTAPATATQFSNNINFNDSNLTPTILLMQWRLTASGYKLMIKENKSSDNNVNFSGFWELNTTLNPSVSFVNGNNYAIQVYANNSPVDKAYTKNNIHQTVAARSCHIWINNVQLLYAIGNPNFKDTGTSLTAGDVLNAFVFLGYNNTSNDAQAYLDDFTYANYLEDINVLPVVLGGFSATMQNNGVRLNWQTLSEKGNASFEILRAGDQDRNFKLIKTILGKGNAIGISTYAALDNSPLWGNNYYKLVQVDANGKTDTLATASTKVSLNKNDFNVYAESENLVKMLVNSMQEQNALLEIYDINGNALVSKMLNLQTGNNQLSVSVRLVKGVYVAVLSTNQNQLKTKFLIK